MKSTNEQDSQRNYFLFMSSYFLTYSNAKGSVNFEFKNETLRRHLEYYITFSVSVDEILS